MIVNTMLWHSCGDFLASLIAASAVCSDVDGTFLVDSFWKKAREVMIAIDATDDANEALEYFTGSRSDIGDIAFIFRSVERLRKAGFSLQAIEKIVKVLLVRVDAMAFLKTFEKKAFVSYGIEQVIAELCRQHGLDEVETFALRLVFGDDGVLVGRDAATVVTDGTKGYKFDTFCATHSLDPRRVVVLGDDLTDLLMLEKGIGIFVVPLADDPQTGRGVSRLRTVENHWNRIGAFSVSDTFASLLQLRQSR
ncbi:MAG: hypothetical protein V1716_05615 [Candidatus Uhrbacteria bacterium]